MRLVIASDIHGSALYCGKLLEAFHREEADKLLLLGDLLYHGPRNDLPEGYDPKTVTAKLNACADRILAVRGNCDAEIDQMVLHFPILADYCLLWAGGRCFFVTHGHLYHTAALPPMQEGDILLHGHTHPKTARPAAICFWTTSASSGGRWRARVSTNCSCDPIKQTKRTEIALRPFSY